MARKNLTPLGDTAAAAGAGKVLPFSRRDALTQNTPIRKLRVDEVYPDPDQPRQHFDEESLVQLAESIKEHGLVQPILVTPRAEGGHQIVAGERRWRAHQIAELLEIDALIKTAEQLKQQGSTFLLGLIENEAREDISAIDKANGYKQAMADEGLSQRALAKALGISQSVVANHVRLLALPEAAREAVASGVLNASVGVALLAAPEEQLDTLVAEAIEGAWTMRDARKAVDALLHPATEAGDLAPNHPEDKSAAEDPGDGAPTPDGAAESPAADSTADLAPNHPEGPDAKPPAPHRYPHADRDTFVSTVEELLQQGTKLNVRVSARGEQITVTYTDTAEGIRAYAARLGVEIPNTIA